MRLSLLTPDTCTPTLLNKPWLSVATDTALIRLTSCVTDMTPPASVGAVCRLLRVQGLPRIVQRRRIQKNAESSADTSCGEDV